MERIHSLNSSDYQINAPIYPTYIYHLSGIIWKFIHIIFKNYVFVSNESDRLLFTQIV